MGMALLITVILYLLVLYFFRFLQIPVPGFSQRIVGVASLTSGKTVNLASFAIPEDMSRMRARMKQAMPSATKSVPRFYLEISRERTNFAWALRQVTEPPKKAVFFVFVLGRFCWEKNTTWNPTKQQNIALTGLCNVAQVFTDGFSTT